ncbi:hypothetical protein GGR28_002070 [Lewinella aquimaris]|uniref:Cobalamin biosynthesis protein CbiG n=1 Tax=Neolewinella aquimaris TaxID=1835722 RepID=A0A840E746_9BACT|nr:hypothetical protein [Neolewinella aquimaris]MBB4079445.1 hypothetical protein [Neolewinella aquimaris]
MFSHFFAIDWSARNVPSPAKPSKDAVWLAEGSARQGSEVATRYFRTRQACVAYVEARLLALHGERVLVGWDFSFGYPKGFAKALRLKGKPAWRAVWDCIDQLVTDEPDNRNNRFCVGAMLNQRTGAPAGPFWGVPTGQSGIFLGSRKDFNYPVPTRRGLLNERRATERLHSRMQPAWKLAYTGSVGSQALLGIPRVRYLRDHSGLSDRSFIWPFEEHWAGNAGAMILHAEIYPSMITLPLTDAIRDREQVESYVRWLRDRQQREELRGLLHRPWGTGDKLHRRVVNHEGWVLGLKSGRGEDSCGGRKKRIFAPFKPTSAHDITQDSLRTDLRLS